MGFSAQLSSLSPAQWCQAFFVTCSSVLLAIQALPPQASKQLLAYGARNPGEGKKTTRTAKKSMKGAGEEARRSQDEQDGSLVLVLRKATSIGQVPHKWFAYFYACSLVCSLFWAQQLMRRGQVVQLIADLQVSREPSSPATQLGQVVLVWAMMALQGSRRLYECLAIVKPGASRMWFVHWLLGIGFYVCVSVSIWVEGSASLQDATAGQLTALLRTPKTFVAAGLYVVGVVQQHRAHRYLASLKKYTLPDKGWFTSIVCAHYTAECLIYTALAIGGAPRGRLFSPTLLAALFFVVVNLGVTGAGTKKWYTEQFGLEKVRHRWIMIPKVF